MRYQLIDTDGGEILHQSNLPPSMWRTRRKGATKRRALRLDGELLWTVAIIGTLGGLAASAIVN